MMTILSLCDYSGVWSQPYADAGYDVIRMDLQHGQDVRLIKVTDLPPIRGILAAPPCTEFAVSGARWWEEKGDGPLLEGLSIVDACLRLVHATQPLWWVLENPVGRLTSYIGPAQYSFDPCDFGDTWTKHTMLWGRFNHPKRTPVEPTEGSKMHLVPPGPERQNIRSETPPGFARAFFESNP